MAEHIIHRATLKFWQRRIVVMGWVTYASYYLGRVNLSTAIPDLREGLQLSSQDVGLLSSGFFLSIFDRFSWSSVLMTLAITAGLTAFFLAVFAWWLKYVKDVRH